MYVGGLDEKVTEALLWELFVQAGPVGMFALDKFLCSVNFAVSKSSVRDVSGAVENLNA